MTAASAQDQSKSCAKIALNCNLSAVAGFLNDLYRSKYAFRLESSDLAESVFYLKFSSLTQSLVLEFWLGASPDFEIDTIEGAIKTEAAEELSKDLYQRLEVEIEERRLDYLLFHEESSIFARITGLKASNK
ncbi:hypothetical protein GC174_18230 [bacterium]|nr:hypothetical protein [bacterium]